MKYLQHKFSSPANSDAYRDGWERTFAAAPCGECGHPEADHHPDGGDGDWTYCQGGAYQVPETDGSMSGWWCYPCTCGHRTGR